MWICGGSRKVCVDCLTHSPSLLLFGAKMSNVDTHCWDRIVQLCSTAQVNHKQFYYLATVDHFQICWFPSCLSFENQLGKGTTNDFGTLLGFFHIYSILAGSESCTYKSLPKVVISFSYSYSYTLFLSLDTWKNPRIASWRHRLVATPGTKASRFRRLRINEPSR